MTIHFRDREDLHSGASDGHQPQTVHSAATLPVGRWKAQAPYGIHRSDWLQAITRVMSAGILAFAIIAAALTMFP